MNVLITGATGFIGQALTKRLLRNGHSVTAWVRDVQRAGSLLGPTVNLIGTDAEGDLNLAVAAADAVVNLAGAPILHSRWTRRRRRELETSRIETTRRLVAAMVQAASPPAVFVSASAIGYYGSHADRILHELSPMGRGFTARLCAAWEDEARRARYLGVRVVRARLGIVLGDGGMLRKVLPLFRAGLGGSLGNGRQFLSWIQLDDAIEALLFAIQDERCRHAVNVVGPHPVRYRQFAAELGRALNRPTWLSTPRFVLRTVLGRRADVLLADQRVIPRELERLGFEYRFPTVRAALAASISHELAPATMPSETTNAIPRQITSVSSS